MKWTRDQMEWYYTGITTSDSADGSNRTTCPGRFKYILTPSVTADVGRMLGFLTVEYECHLTAYHPPTNTGIAIVTPTVSPMPTVPTSPVFSNFPGTTFSGALSGIYSLSGDKPFQSPAGGPTYNQVFEVARNLQAGNLDSLLANMRVILGAVPSSETKMRSKYTVDETTELCGWTPTAALYENGVWYHVQGESRTPCLTVDDYKMPQAVGDFTIRWVAWDVANVNTPVVLLSSAGNSIPAGVANLNLQVVNASDRSVYIAPQINSTPGDTRAYSMQLTLFDRLSIEF